MEKDESTLGNLRVALQDLISHGTFMNEGIFGKMLQKRNLDFDT